MTSRDIHAEFQRAIGELQRTLADRLAPAMGEAAFQVGRFALAMYLTMPWYRRVWSDLRYGRAVKNVREALIAVWRLCARRQP